jgi:hypothetical protein
MYVAVWKPGKEEGGVARERQSDDHVSKQVEFMSGGSIDGPRSWTGNNLGSLFPGLKLKFGD